MFHNLGFFVEFNNKYEKKTNKKNRKEKKKKVLIAIN